MQDEVSGVYQGRIPVERLSLWFQDDLYQRHWNQHGGVRPDETETEVPPERYEFDLLMRRDASFEWQVDHPLRLMFGIFECEIEKPHLIPKYELIILHSGRANNYTLKKDDRTILGPCGDLTKPDPSGVLTYTLPPDFMITPPKRTHAQMLKELREGRNPYRRFYAVVNPGGRVVETHENYDQAIASVACKVGNAPSNDPRQYSEYKLSFSGYSIIQSNLLKPLFDAGAIW